MFNNTRGNKVNVVDLVAGKVQRVGMRMNNSTIRDVELYFELTASS